MAAFFLLPTAFGLSVCGVFLCCVAGGGVEDEGGGFVCFACFFSSYAACSMWCGFPGDARMRETASRSWNKVLRASLFYAVVSSGGGVASVSLGFSSLCTGVCILFSGFVVRRGVTGVRVLLWSSRFVVVGGFGFDSKEPTAVFSYRVPFAAYQGWKSALRVGKVMIGVSKPRCGAGGLAELRWR